MTTPSTDRLFIIAESRSGSNWLVETLNYNPDIFLLKEIFQPKQRIKFSENKNLSSLKEIDSDIDYLEKQLEESNKKISGCKILTSQAVRFLDFYKFVEFYSNKAAFIILSRLNSVKAEISGEIARKWERRHERVFEGDLLRVRLDPLEFLKRLQWRKLRNEFVRGLLTAYKVRMVEIKYEILFCDRIKEIKKILDFLDIHGDVKSIRFSDEEKSNPFPIEEIVENYWEIAEFLKSYPDYYTMWKDD